MAQNRSDIELLADLNVDSSEQLILKSIKIIEKRLKANHDARFKLNAEIDETVINNTINKLQNILKSKDLSIDTQKSIRAITEEVNAMGDIVTTAKKAASEKLDFAKANEKVRKSAEDTSSAINRERQAMENLDDLDYILHNINMYGASGNNVFRTFGDTLNDAFSTYTVANLLTDSIRKTVDVGKEAINTVKELDDTATSLRMATGASKSVVDQYMSDYNEMGQMLGEITTSTAEAADSYLRQGHSIADTNELIKDSLMLSHIANLETADSTDYLTSIMRAYKLEAGEVLGVVDKLSKVDLSAAVDAGGIAEAMSKTATSAQQVGVTIDQLIGMVSTVGEVTQAGMSEVGNSIRTIFSRMRDIKDGNLTSIGEDGEIKTLSNIEGTLGAIGVQLRASNDEFRNFYTVLDETASKWENLTSVQKAAVTEVYSGVRQSEKFNVLMENWDKVKKYAQISEESAGTASEKFGAYLDSLQAKTNSLKASLEKLATTTIPDELYASVLDTSKAVVDLTTDTGVLKGLLAGLGTSGSIYVFRQLAGYLGDATQGFVNLNEAMSMTRSGAVGINNMQRLIDLTGGLSQSQTRLLLSTNNLTDAQKIAVLVNQNLAQGMSQETAEATARATLNMWGLTAAQQGATNAGITLNGVLRGLWATLLANPLVLVTAAVTAGTMAFNAYKQHLEEIRQATSEAANTFKESSSSIDEYASRYQELRQALLDAKGNEEETYNVKKQLLDLQTELNDKFGDEYGRLSLLTDAYKDQTEAIKAYNKEAAQTYLNENQKGIKDAEKQMTKERHYNLSGVGISQYTDAGSALRDIAEQYKNQGISLLDNEDGTYSVHLNADATSAYDTINSFENNLREKAKELGDEHLFDDVLEISSDSLNNAKDTIEKFGDTFKQALIAEIAVDDTKANTYTKALSAVDNYNNAVISSFDPYNDENVQKARQDLEAVKQEIQNNEAEWGKYSLLMNDVFSQADTHIFDFNQKLQNDTGLQKLAEDLQGLQDVDLEALNPGENESFDKLKESAEEAGVSVEELIDLLIRAGIVQGEIVSQAENTSLAFDTTSLEDLNDQIDSLQSAYKALYSASEEYNQNGYVTADTLQTLLALDSEYLACLIDENGQLAINGTAYQNLVQAKLADAEATAVQQAIEELSKVTTEQQIEADKTAIGIIAEKGSVLASLTGQYGALADVAVSAAQAQALADGYTEASNKNKAEADKIMSNLNAKLALIQSTAKNTAGSFGSLTNHLNGFSSASSKAKDSTDAFTKSLQKQKDALEDEKEVLEDKKEYYEKVSAAGNWFFDKQIKGVEKVISGLEKENDLLKDQLGDFDSALSAVDRFYERQQKALKDKITAMKEATTQSEKELAVEKAKMALQEAQRNKTKVVYTKNRGLVFQTDTDAIKSANDNLANANADLVEYKIQQEIDKIQELRDAWAEIPKIKQQAEQDSLASQIIGSNWEAQLLNGRLETINTFKDSYLGIQAEIDNNESMIASYEEKVQYYQNLKDEWQSLTDRYTEYENTQLLIMEFGNDYQNELLNGRTERWDKFADDFFNVQVQLKSVTDQIADITKRMEEYAARMEAAASRAESAAARIKAAGSGTGGGSKSSNIPRFRDDAIGAHAKGGFITKKDKSFLDPIAEAVGEDHVVVVQEGEAVIPKESVQKNPELVNAIIDGKSKPRYTPITNITLGGKTFAMDEFYEMGKRLVASPQINLRTDIFKEMLDRGNIVNNTTNNNQQQKSITLSIGDIHVHDVQDTNGLSRAIIEQLPNAIMQELKRR